MRQFVASILLLGCISSYASEFDYSCKEAYKLKLEKVESNRIMRKAGKFGLIAGMAVGGLFLPTLWLGQAGGITGAFVTGPMLGSSGSLVHSLFDREPGLIQATQFFRLSQIDKEELREELYEEFIIREMADHNYFATNSNMWTIEDTKKEYPIDSLKDWVLSSVFHETLNKVNESRDREVSYEEFQKEVLNLLSTDAFCPTNKRGKNKPKTLRQVIKILKKS